MWGNQWHDCTLDSGEGHRSRGEMFCSLYAAVMFHRRLNTLYKLAAGRWMYIKPRWGVKITSMQLFIEQFFP
jgi:hypothetical protein